MNRRRLVGPPAAPGREADLHEFWPRLRNAVMATIVSINLIGAVTVVVMAAFIVPLPAADSVERLRVSNVVAAGVYVAVVVPVAALLGVRHLRPLRRWASEVRPANDDEKRILLQAPMRLFVLQVACWWVAALAFGAFDLITAEDPIAGFLVGATIALTGATTAACSYLATEVLLRPAAVRALADGLPQDQAVPGVATRAVLAWALGTGLPIVGLLSIGVLHLAGINDATADELAVAVAALCGVGLVVGLLAVGMAARATAAPIDTVRAALDDIRRGQFDRRVAVFDGTQVGQLQIGFNVMAEGLGERERIRAAFGAYVDPAVAELVVEEGGVLDGAEVEVSVLFLDIRDFTALAERIEPAAVVSTLNRLFASVIPIVHERGGRVDKFIGDGLMAVFGAPRHLEDHADRAVDAAIRIAAEARDGALGDIEIGIGINSGRVVAGSIGTPERLEFGVIGDAVNVAARTEAETRSSGDLVLLTEHTERLLRDDRSEIVERHRASLKGKSETVQLFAVDLDHVR